MKLSIRLMMTRLFILRFVVLMVSCMPKVIREGQNSNVKVSTIEEKLFQAVEEGNLEKVTALIAAGAEVNAKNKQGNTPLHVAAMNGHKDIVEALVLKADTEVNAKNKQGNTPLHVAAMNGHKDIVEALVLKADTEVNAKNNQGDTPLHEAARYGDEGIVEVLLAAGANIKVTNKDGATPLHVAAMNGYKGIVEALLDAGAQGKVSTTEEELLQAVEDGDLKKVKELLEEGAYVNTEDGIGSTPLYVAVRNGHKDIVDLLIEKGADVNKGNHYWGNTPVYVAVLYNYQDIVRALLAARAEVNKGDHYWGDTPLHEAAMNGHVVLAALLLVHGAQVDVRNKEGNTPLQVTKHGNEVLAALLLDHKEYLEKYSRSNDPEEIDPGIANLPQEIIAQEIIPRLSIYDVRKFLVIPNEIGKYARYYLTAKLKELNEKGDTLSAQDQANQLLIRTILEM